jgi:hypothetical protein
LARGDSCCPTFPVTEHSNTWSKSEENLSKINSLSIYPTKFFASGSAFGVQKQPQYFQDTLNNIFCCSKQEYPPSNILRSPLLIYTEEFSVDDVSVQG